MAKIESVETFIANNSLDTLKARTEFEQPFKVYKPLDAGNSKLEPNIFSFSMIPVVTCGTRCKGCYDLRSLRYPSVREKRTYNTWLSLNKQDVLEEAIVNQINKSKKLQFVRIHVGGDFYSLDYVAMWGRIVEAVKATRPEVKFYTYTKSKFSDEIELCGINVVPSLVKGLGYNFGPEEKLNDFTAKNEGYTICPATVKATKEATKCGINCTACMDKSKVLFVEH